VTRDVRLTNLKKVFWPEDGYTKGDLIGYYDSVAPLLLPYLPRPSTRADAVSGRHHGEILLPEGRARVRAGLVRTETVHSGDGERDIRYFVIDDVESLRYVANLGTVRSIYGARA